MLKNIEFIETESFTNYGGWILDTQFYDIMDSPYLLAHGMGVPVKDAETTVDFKKTGRKHVFVRTKDWVAHWNAAGTPGRFKLLIDDIPINETFGTKGADWHWHYGGIVNIDKKSIKLTLHDLTGFDGRCDAICFVDYTAYLPSQKELDRLREESIISKGIIENTDKFDIIIAGGGYSGMCAALTASRRGLKTALIQDRPVLGGNASREIRIPLCGLISENDDYPRLGEILKELQYNDKATYADIAGPDEDKRYYDIFSKEENVTLFMKYRLIDAQTENDTIKSVTALDMENTQKIKLSAKLFADCTGHAHLGYYAGAEYETPEGMTLGMSNTWSWENVDESINTDFPENEWSLDLEMSDFPVPTEKLIPFTHNWESGFYLDHIKDLEYIRDWNLRAVYGAWEAVKNKDDSGKYKNAKLMWVSGIGGTRESRRLIGEHVLLEDDMLNDVKYDDAFIPVTWHLDRHVPNEKYTKFKDNPFISRGQHKPGTDKSKRDKHGAPYWGVPYRCLYSRNIKNLFMAGRNISSTYWSSGAIRVMRTCGLMGEIVGMASAVCIEKGCLPNEVYSKYLDDLKKHLK